MMNKVDQNATLGELALAESHLAPPVNTERKVLASEVGVGDCQLANVGADKPSWEALHETCTRNPQCGRY